VAKKKEHWDAEKRREQQRLARVAAYGDEGSPRDRARRDYPLGAIGTLVAAPEPEDFEEATADLVVALGLVGREVNVEGHTRLGGLVVAALDDPIGFDIKQPRHVRAVYRAMSIPVAQFRREG
jgi:hypothetical protein